MTGTTPPRARPAAPTNLPAPLSSFVGREREIAEVTRRLAGGARLVTLTGPGGAGKTRLAMQVAARLLSAFPDGVWLVDLAPLTDAALVPQAVASAAGVPEDSRSPALATLCRALRQRRVLLVVDNCEHLMNACAALVEAVLGACPQVQVLATSRERLRVAGETVWRVPMLAVPPPSPPLPAEALARYESVRLFVERAGAVQPRFGLTPGNAPTVAQICRRLDGLPLAIELAATRTHVLSVEEILARLEDRFRLLTGGSRTALPHQETLRAAVEWSYDLLTEAERSLFARLAVFAGGWTLAAAEAVAGNADPASAGQERPIAANDVLDLLTRLADKSMVVVDGDGAGPSRYRLLETLRQYAARRLEAGGRAQVYGERHLDYFAALAEQAEPELKGPAQQTWLDRLEREHDNCRAALQWALAHPTAATIEGGLCLAGALMTFWWPRGHLREARSWFERLLAAPVPAAPTVARARVLCRAAIAAGILGAADDQNAERTRYETSLAVARAAADPRTRAWALFALARGAFGRRDDAAALRWMAESVELFRQTDDLHGLAETLRNIGRLARFQGDYAAARGHYQESLAIYRRTVNRWAEAGVLHDLGYALRAAGDVAGSRPLHEAALAIWREQGYRNGVAGALNALGEVAHAEGHLATARSLFEESLAGYQELGARRFAAAVLKNLALLESATDQPAAARAHLAEAIAIWRELGAEALLASALEEFAARAAARGQPELALRLAGAADSLRAAAGRPRAALLQARLDDQLAPARQVLGAAAAEDARAAGSALALDQALAEAVGEPAGDGGSAIQITPAEGASPLSPTGRAAAPAGPLRVDGQTYTVWRGAQPLARPLSAQEFALVRYLYERCERVCTRGELGDAIWGTGAWDPNMLYRLVRRVKEKLEPQPNRPHFLQTAPGIGYRLVP